MTVEMNSKLEKKAGEIVKLQQFHSSAISQVQEHLSTTKINLEKVLAEKIEIENDLFVVREEKETIEKEVVRLKRGL